MRWVIDYTRHSGWWSNIGPGELASVHAAPDERLKSGNLS